MFESIGELAVVSVLLGATVLAFAYLAYRGARLKRSNGERTEAEKGDARHKSPKGL